MLSARGPLIGYALEISNRSLEFQCFASPHEVLEAVRAQRLDFRNLVNHTDTGIKTVEIFKVAPKVEFSGGPHAETTLEILEAIDEKDLKRLALLVRHDPAALTEDEERGVVPLLTAVSSGDVAAVRILLSGGAEADRASHLGMTPLHWAAALGEIQVVDALLEAGASAQRLSWFFVAANELAALNKNREAERAFRRHGIDETAAYTPKLVLSRMATSSSGAS